MRGQQKEQVRVGGLNAIPFHEAHVFRPCENSTCLPFKGLL
jgi:hypothetical protein